MAKITWSVGDFFVFANPEVARGGAEKLYGIVTSHEEECTIVCDSGLRTERYTIAATFMPDDALPSDLAGANYEVKMALYATKLQMGRCGANEVRVP